MRLMKAEHGFDFLIPEHLLDHSWKAKYCIVGLLQFNLVLLLFLKDRILICSQGFQLGQLLASIFSLIFISPKYFNCHYLDCVIVYHQCIENQWPLLEIRTSTSTFSYIYLV